MGRIPGSGGSPNREGAKEQDLAWRPCSLGRLQSAYCERKVRPHRAKRQLCEVSKAVVIAGDGPMARKDDYEIIFRPYIRKNGKIIRPKKGKVFPIKVRKKR